MNRLLTEEVAQWIGREVVYSAPDGIEQGAIRLYAMALADDNPLYTDEQFAKATRHGGIVAPPTMVCETNQYVTREPGTDGYSGHAWKLPLPPCRMIRIGNDYKFLQPLRPGDHLRVKWRIVAMEERTTRLGPMLFVISEVEYWNNGGVKLATNRETVAFRPLGEEGTKVG